MRALVLRFLLLPIGLAPVASGHGSAHAPFANFVFGLSLNPGQNNQLFTLFLVKEFEGSVIQADPMTREQFVLQAQGLVPSKANPESENLFRRYKVKACLSDDPDTVGHYLLDCEVFDDLWKLRFMDYPYRLGEGQHPGRGWAEKRESPSPRQLLLLTDFGMLRLGDLARGENVFRLLHNVGDSAWVDNYRKGL